MKEYSDGIAKAIRCYLDSNGWCYSFDKQQGIFCFILKIGTSLRGIDYQIHIEKNDYIVYAYSPIGIHDHVMMVKMNEYISRANYGIRPGNFEIDMDHGELRYKYYVCCEGNMIPNNGIIEESINVPGVMFRRYIPGAIGVLFQNESPADMVKQWPPELRDNYREHGP